MTPAPCHRHYNDITWPQERHWKHLEPAITTRGLTITFPPLTTTRAQTVKRELRSALLMKKVPWFPNSIAWPLRYIGHLPFSACTCLQITQILDKRDKVTLTLIQILDLKSSGARRSHSVSFEWNLFFSFSVTSSSKQESLVVLTLTKVTKITMLQGVIINCCCYSRRWQ